MRYYNDVTVLIVFIRSVQGAERSFTYCIVPNRRAYVNIATLVSKLKKTSALPALYLNDIKILVTLSKFL